MSYTAGTHTVKPKDVKREWFLIDAQDLVLGRLSAEVAKILRGKHKPSYTPNINTGDHVVITNADKICLTGKKMDDMLFHWHTGYPGGLKTRTVRERLEGKRPENVVFKAIERMMPKDSPLARQQMKNLYVYAGDVHKHEAQKPKKLDIAAKNSKNKKKGN